MNKIDIEKCSDIEVLRKLCLEQYKQLGYVNETLVEERNTNIAVKQIRDYLVDHQFELEINN